MIDAADFQLDSGDLLSIQGFGRAMITDIGGKTKKIKCAFHIKRCLNNMKFMKANINTLHN